MMSELLAIITKVICVYIIIFTVSYTIQFAIAVVSVRNYFKKMRSSGFKKYIKSQNIIPISLIVPAYNEDTMILSNIKALLQLDYQIYEVVVVNDGSSDQTLEKIMKEFDLKPVTISTRNLVPSNEIKAIYKNADIPKLVLVDKVNGGKADALNAGLNVSKYPYFGAIDADSILESDALVRVSMPFIENKKTVASGGSIRILNGVQIENGKIQSVNLPKNMLASFQVLEYFRAFISGRMTWDRIGSVLIISGAFGLFKKEVVAEVGGFTTDGIAEDMELVVRIHRRLKEKKVDYRIKFIPDPVCWTQAPENLSDLWSQRRRWQVGLLDTLFKHKRMLFNPRYGVHGMVTVPYFWFFEALGTIMVPLGYILVPLGYFMGSLDVELFLLFLGMNILLGIILSLGAIFLEQYAHGKYPKLGQLLKITIYAFLENFGYRQLMLFSRLDGMVRYKKFRHSWSKIKRESVE